MPIDQGTETIDVKTTDATWRMEVFLENVTQLRFHRWLVKSDAESGEWIGDPDQNAIPVVQRTMAQVAAKSYTAAGITATGNQILALMNRMSDVERQWDIDNPPGGPSEA